MYGMVSRTDLSCIFPYCNDSCCKCSGRSDRLMRIEAASEESASSSTATVKNLKSCPDCRMAFYCSDTHWSAVQHEHAGEPCEDSHEGLSQCQLNQEIRVDVNFANITAGAKAGEFHWAPERVKPAWTSLRNISWEDEFGPDLARQFRIPVSSVGSWIRAASKSLSMPMTALWALENLKKDDAWTHQDTLTIHVQYL
jgi:splicing suppressor protein 51